VTGTRTYVAWPEPKWSWSRELRILRDDLAERDRFFLSWALDRPRPQPTSRLEQLQLEAFVLSSHALIERYLEERIIEVADAIELIAISSSDATVRPVTSTLAWNLPKEDEPRRRLKVSDLPYLKVSINRIRKLVDRNNGIKDTNLGKMVEPFGCTVADFGARLGGVLKEAGKKRGEIAHGVTVGAVFSMSAQDEATRYLQILEDLPLFEDRLAGLL
jgi:hypothetical protein